jgi:hypothetical protein
MRRHRPARAIEKKAKAKLAARAAAHVASLLPKLPSTSDDTELEKSFRVIGFGALLTCARAEGADATPNDYIYLYIFRVAAH